MSDDIVDRLRVIDNKYTEFWQQRLMDEAADEIVRLRRWKAEAVAVLDAWNDAWMAAGRPGPLGASTAVATAIEIGRLRERVSELEQGRANGFAPPFPNRYILVGARYDDSDVQRMELTVTTIGPFDVDAIRSLMGEYITLDQAASNE